MIEYQKVHIFEDLPPVEYSIKKKHIFTIIFIFQTNFFPFLVKKNYWKKLKTSSTEYKEPIKRTIIYFFIFHKDRSYCCSLTHWIWKNIRSLFLFPSFLCLYHYNSKYANLIDFLSPDKLLFIHFDKDTESSSLFNNLFIWKDHSDTLPSPKMFLQANSTSIEVFRVVH